MAYDALLAVRALFQNEININIFSKALFQFLLLGIIQM